MTLFLSEARALMERQHIEACRALGVGAWRVMLKHLLPNILNTVIVVASFSIATNILTESALSFLGLGVDVSIPTWGGMRSEAHTSELQSQMRISYAVYCLQKKRTN